MSKCLRWYIFALYVFWMIRKGKRFDSKYDPEIKDDRIPILVKVGLFFKNNNSS